MQEGRLILKAWLVNIRDISSNNNFNEVLNSISWVDEEDGGKEERESQLGGFDNGE